MFKLTAALIVALSLLVIPPLVEGSPGLGPRAGLPSSSAEAEGRAAPVSPASAADRRCARRYTRADFHRIARRAYDGKARATRHERRTLNRVRRCQAKPRQTRKLIVLHSGRYRRGHHYRLAVNAVTPYGPYAIPAYVVACESGGSWSAYNASGAAGIYQIMPEWGRPWPVNSRADKLAHHRIAYRLWNGGAGASNWVCA